MALIDVILMSEREESTLPDPPLFAEPEARDLGWTTGSTSGASSASPNFGLAHLRSVLCFALAAVVVPQLGAGGRLLFSDQ